MPVDTLTAPLPGRRSQPTGRSVTRAPVELGVAVLVVGAWLLFAPRTPDLAAQFYRTGLFSHHGMLVWDNSWYAGHYMPGYSLIFPPLAEILGVRIVGALSVIASTFLFGRIARRAYGPGSMPAAVWFAIAAAGGLWIGRITFALGVAFALGAVLALMSRRGRWAGVLAALMAALCAASSPVAGLLLALAAGTHMIARRRLTPAIGVIAVVLIVLLPLEGIFPDGGYEPYPFLSFLASTTVGLAFIWSLPRGERLLLSGGWIFVAANCLSLIHTPMGSNIARYAVLLAGPLLLCALAATRGEERGRGEEGGRLEQGGRREAGLDGHPGSRGMAGSRAGAGLPALASATMARLAPSSERARRSEVSRGLRGLGLARLHPLRAEPRPRIALAAVLAGFAVWVAWGPVTQTEVVAGDPSTQPAFYLPVRRFLASRVHRPVRIEVPFTRSHWAAALLAPYVSLAGGWERQLAKRYNRAIEADPLAPAVYRRWLDRNAVSYVALPSVPLDGSSLGEARLIEQHPAFLKQVYRSADWRIYRVIGARGLAEGPGRLTGMSHDGFQLHAHAAGRFLVRVHYTPYWDVVAGRASVTRGPGGWTVVSARAPGRIALQATFSLQAALRLL